MRIIIACIIAAMLGLTEAAFKSGKKCPTTSTIAYQSDMATRTLHRYLYADSTTYSYLQQLMKLVPQYNVNLTCYNDGTYGVSQSKYFNKYQNTSNPLMTNVLYFEPVTATTVFYLCVDQAEFKTLLAEAAKDSSIVIPPVMVSSISKLLALGHFDGFLITSSVTSLSTSVINSLTAAVKAQIPSFSMSDMTAFPQTGC